MPFKTVYWFQDTSSAATCAGNPCQSMEAWYDDYPTRPHGGRCDCPIHLYFGWATTVWDNFRIVGGGFTSRELGYTIEYENPHKTKEETTTVNRNVTIKRSVSISVSNIMEHFGFSASGESTETIAVSQPITIPARHRAIIKLTISGSVTYYTGDKYATFAVLDGSGAFTGAPDGGTVLVERNVEGGSVYQEGSDVDFDVSYEPLDPGP